MEAEAEAEEEIAVERDTVDAKSLTKSLIVSQDLTLERYQQQYFLI